MGNSDDQVPEIFISYAREDRDVAMHLAKALERNGWSVWWDRKLLAGTTFDQVIDDALMRASCVIVLWSKHSVKSNWVKNEAAEGLRRDILVPVLVEDVRVPIQFRHLHSVAPVKWSENAIDHEYERFVESIVAYVGQPPTRAPDDADDKLERTLEPGPAEQAEPVAAARVTAPSTPKVTDSFTPALEIEPTRASREFRRGGTHIRVALASGLLVVVALSIFLFAIRGKGDLVLTVIGARDERIPGIEVFVDGAKASCSASPCRIADLSTGVRNVRVSAPEYAEDQRSVVILQGQQVAETVTLRQKGSNTGLYVTSTQPDLRLWIDDEPIGALPQTVRNMKPGTHRMRVSGGPRYEPLETSVSIVPDRLLKIEPRLKVSLGLLKITPGTNATGAKVYVVHRSERTPVSSLPHSIELRGGGYTVIAEKTGFATFEKEVSFPDGEAERTIVVDLAAVPAPAPVQSSQPSPAEKPITKPAPPAKQSKESKTTLTCNSIPVSQVVLDGVPLGNTPRIVEVTPGEHLVVFHNDEYGRKEKTVTVEEGKHASAAVRFP